MSAAVALVALAAALVLQATAVPALGVGGAAIVDLVLVVVVAIGLVFGPTAGILAGSVAGLIQDGLTSGILGVGGLSKTVVAFLAGRAGTQFIVTSVVPRFTVFAAAAVVHGALFSAIYGVLGLPLRSRSLRGLAAEAVAAAIIGVLGLQFVERVPRLLERHRATRSMRVSR